MKKSNRERTKKVRGRNRSRSLGYKPRAARMLAWVAGYGYCYGW